MTPPAVGQPVTDFEATASGGDSIRLSELQGHNVVLYFYPKDNTPGCTDQARQFRDRLRQFAELDTVILGVSRDSLKSHANFQTKHDLPFPLLSDPDETLCRQFDVIKLKKNYGREYLGVERSTFLIDKTGVLRREWRKVKVAGHADDVLEATRTL